MAGKERVTVDMTTGIGTLSFPHVFPSTAGKNDKGETTYDIQIIIPKSQREDIRAILRAIKEVGEAKWGAKWKQVRTPLRDGDKEKDELTEDGSTKGEKYPERLGCYFLNARSSKPVGVYDRTRNVITDVNEIYGGCRGKIAVTFYAYSSNGNHGVGAGLNGVQKIGDGEAFGGGRPSVESMFDLLEDDEDTGLDDGELEDDFEDDEPEPAPKKRPAAKKTAPAKKAAARRKPEPEPEDEDDEDLDEYDDLDDLD
jgi:hypothetical protein